MLSSHPFCNLFFLHMLDDPVACTICSAIGTVSTWKTSNSKFCWGIRSFSWLWC
ncbi:hypothetical protein M758_6G146100 [Ceratodon purpureus]|nr:hypothetical protein M758_6G146100 [Ceratodon purpureus]